MGKVEVFVAGAFVGGLLALSVAMFPMSRVEKQLAVVCAEVKAKGYSIENCKEGK